MTDARACPKCGAQSQSRANFCTSCGAGLPAGFDIEPHQADETPVDTPTASVSGYRISPDRIVVMSILSWGFYLFYWFYLTWKQYRDYTQSVAYPVWHATAIGAVPIYSLFRVHAHMRTFRELMLQAGLTCSISAGAAVYLMIGIFVLNGAAFAVAEFRTPYQAALIMFMIDIGSVSVVILLLYNVQKNLNRYWRELSAGPHFSTRPSVGEVVLAVIGILLWTDAIASILSESYRLV